MTAPASGAVAHAGGPSAGAADGLSSEEARYLMAEVGPNEVVEPPPHPAAPPYPYYPGRPPCAPTPQPRDDSPKKDVIRVVILIAAVATFTVIVNLIHLGFTDSSEGPGTTAIASLAAPDVQRAVRDGSTVWDAEINITRVARTADRVAWSSISVMVTSGAGQTILVDGAPLYPDSGLYDDRYPIAVELWYIETVPGIVVVAAGDAFKITGMPLAYEGATIQFFTDMDLFAATTLPTDFP